MLLTSSADGSDVFLVSPPTLSSDVSLAVSPQALVELPDKPGRGCDHLGDLAAGLPRRPHERESRQLLEKH